MSFKISSNAPDIQECLKECERITSIANYYLPMCEQMFENFQSQVVRKEYGVGGECIHRGYYCPDIISDIVIGNMKRGRIYKNTAPDNPTYLYGFDENGVLLTVQKFDENECQEYEIILCDNQKEVGITFSRFEGQTEIIGILECSYDVERITSYNQYLINGFDDNRVTELKVHNYKYSESNMLVHCYNFINYDTDFDELLNNNKIKISLDNFLASLDLPSVECCADKNIRSSVQCDVYNFKITNGYLNSYTVKHIGDKISPDNTIVYKVYTRRKV